MAMFVLAQLWNWCVYAKLFIANSGLKRFANFVQFGEVHPDYDIVHSVTFVFILDIENVAEGTVLYSVHFHR